MTRCRICSKQTSAPTEIKDPRWTLFKGVPVNICPTCFDLWSRGCDDELELRVKEKLIK